MRRSVKVHVLFLFLVMSLLFVPGCGRVNTESTQSEQPSGSEEGSLPAESSSELESEDEAVIQLEENEGVDGL